MLSKTFALILPYSIVLHFPVDVAEVIIQQRPVTLSGNFSFEGVKVDRLIMHVVPLGHLPDFGNHLSDPIVDLKKIGVGGFNSGAILTGPLVLMDVYGRFNRGVPARKGIDVHPQVYRIHFAFVFNVSFSSRPELQPVDSYSMIFKQCAEKL